MNKKVIIQYVKEVLSAIFWVTIFLSIFIPSSLEFFLTDGFIK